MRSRTFIATVEGGLAGITRVIAIFRTRGLDVVSLDADRTYEPGVARVTVVVEADDVKARRIVPLLEKLLCVVDAKEVTSEGEAQTKAA
jgi:acetolactate synthase small subunit